MINLYLLIQLGGVILPHDGLCKVTSPGNEYNDWDIYDYPSIGQIAEALRRNDIIPIFAAEARAKPIYDVSMYTTTVTTITLHTCDISDIMY